MKRREFIAMLGGAAGAPALWPLAARAQQASPPVVAVLRTTSPDSVAAYLAAFRKGLADAGYVENLNVLLEIHWPKGPHDRLDALAANLVRRRVALIFASGGLAAARAAINATSKIPIVFVNGSDAVEAGLVERLNRPGRNVTGVSLIAASLAAKRLEVLHELVPSISTVAMLVNPDNPSSAVQLKNAQKAADTLRLSLDVLNARDGSDINSAFVTMAKSGAKALLVGADFFFNSRRDQIIALANRDAVSAIFDRREFVEAGGLVSYGTRFSDVFYEAGEYAGRILKGEKPSELPVKQPTKFELLINLKTARTLGLTVPLPLLGRADEVIE